MKILLKNLSHIATFDDEQRELSDADILVDGPSIKLVGRELSEDGVDRVIDGRGMLATPGLINSHQHLWQASIRTLPQLERSGMPEFLHAQNTIGIKRWQAGRLGAKEQRAIARAALTESVLNGITTVADQHLFFPGVHPEPYVEATIAAAGDVGVRLHACRGSVTFSKSNGGMVSDELAEPVESIIAHCRELIANHHDPEPFAMVRIVLAPGGVVSDVGSLFEQFAELAAGEHETVHLHTHLHHFEDTKLAQKIFGKSPWQMLREYGFANKRLWVAHCPTAPLDEISEYVEAGIGIAHIPAADLKLGWGLAPVRAWLDAGLNVGAATTGSMTNDGGNLLNDLRVAALAHRTLDRNDPERWLTARELLHMATRGSAACLGRNDLGALAPGLGADIACWDMRTVDRVGIHDPVAALLFTGLSQIAHTVLVNGRVVVERGQPTLVDAVEVAETAREHIALDIT